MGTIAASSSSSLGALSTIPAITSSPSPALVPTPSLSITTVRLTSKNFLLWKAQVLPPLRIHQLMGYIDGTLTTPEKVIVNDKDESIPNTAYTA